MKLSKCFMVIPIVKLRNLRKKSIDIINPSREKTFLIPMQKAQILMFSQQKKRIKQPLKIMLKFRL